jgi:hypothetical protein
MTDLSPEDDVAGGSEIYYFTDEDGNINSTHQSYFCCRGD